MQPGASSEDDSAVWLERVWAGGGWVPRFLAGVPGSRLWPVISFFQGQQVKGIQTDPGSEWEKENRNQNQLLSPLET